MVSVLVLTAWLGCAADPLVAWADPLVAVRPGGFSVGALVSDATATLSVAKLPAGTRCGFLLGEDLDHAVPLGEGRADGTGVASLSCAVPGGTRGRASVHAVCALGAEVYSAQPVPLP